MYMFRTALSILHTAQWYPPPAVKGLFKNHYRCGSFFPLSGIAARLLIMAFDCLPECHAKSQMTGITAL